MATVDPAIAAPVTPVVLGIDLGTSAVKVVATSADSKVIAAGSAAFPTLTDLSGQAEQEPSDWLQAVRAAIGKLDRNLSTLAPRWRQQIRGVGLTGQLPTLVCIGAHGALGRAITWKDARADSATGAVLNRQRRRKLYEQTGMPLDGRYLGPMYRHHWLGRQSEVQCILSAKDFLSFTLTGNRVTDPSTAAGYGAFDLKSGKFSDELCELWQMPASALPDVRPAHCAAGSLDAAGAELLGLEAGIPVSVGAADSVSSALAMAGLEEGIACITMGSSTVIIDAVRGISLDPHTRFLLTPHVEPGWYGREMDLLATGTGYRWLCELLGVPDGVLDQKAAESAPGAHGLMFAPYLAGGEQGALWDPSLRGALTGLTLYHTPSDIARAFMEGVGFEIRRCLEVLSDTMPVREVVISGHITAHQKSLQMLANILNQPVRPYPSGSPAAWGAALGALKMLTSRAQSRQVDDSWPAVVRPTADSDLYHRLYRQYVSRTQAQKSADATRIS